MKGVGVMKFKIFRHMFWYGLGLMLTGIAIIIFIWHDILTGNTDIRTQEIPLWIGIIAMFSFGFYTVLIHMKDHFSFITITETGVDVTFLGRSWFKASWDEIKYIGEVGVWHFNNGMACLYLSKVPITIDESIFKFGTPCSAIMDHQTVFLDAKSKLRTEILKYVSEDRLNPSGEIQYYMSFLTFKTKKKKL